MDRIFPVGNDPYFVLKSIGMTTFWRGFHMTFLKSGIPALSFNPPDIIKLLFFYIFMVNHLASTL